MKYWDRTPKQSIEAECVRRGKDAVVAGCIRLLGGGDVDYRLVAVLAGPVADDIVDRASGDPQRYWLRVWGARGPMWAWDDGATEAIRAGLDDPHWRVREMSAKVVARHALGDLLEPVSALRTDSIPRVRTAAARALTILTAKSA